VRNGPARRTALIGTLCGLLLGACAGERAAPEVPNPTVRTEPATTATTNPYAVPAVIDAAYVNRVLAWFDQVEGDVVRRVVAARTLSPEDIAVLRAINASDGQFQVALDAYQYTLRTGLGGFLPNPGNEKTVVLEVLSAKSSCVYVKVDRDATAVARNPNPSFRTQWVALRRLDSPPSPSNPTGWGYVLNGGGFGPSPRPPDRDPCAQF
jgi:hypothetical protein